MRLHLATAFAMTTALDTRWDAATALLARILGLAADPERELDREPAGQRTDPALEMDLDAPAPAERAEAEDRGSPAESAEAAGAKHRSPLVIDLD